MYFSVQSTTMLKSTVYSFAFLCRGFFSGMRPYLFTVHTVYLGTHRGNYILFTLFSKLFLPNFNVRMTNQRLCNCLWSSPHLLMENKPTTIYIMKGCNISRHQNMLSANSSIMLLVLLILGDQDGGHMNDHRLTRLGNESVGRDCLCAGFSVLRIWEIIFLLRRLFPQGSEKVRETPFSS